MSHKPESVSQIVHDLAALKAEDGQVSVGQVIQSFGGRSYGPSLLVPALLGISPVGAIPGVPAFFALMIGIFAIQILIGRTHLWLPAFIADRSFAAETLEAARQKLEAPARFLDRIFQGRLEWAIRPPFTQVAALLIVVLCVIIVPLELIPLAAALPFSAIAAFGLAMMVRDGVLMLLAIAVSFGSFWFALQPLLG